jgi:NAD(P)-dependent dehydrogenase (short-subunit alcohol dehydrogenase family)
MKKNTNLFSLKNKVVLITGAGRGIGKYLAEQIAKQEAIVFSIDKEFQKKNIKKCKKYFRNRV